MTQYSLSIENKKLISLRENPELTKTYRKLTLNDFDRLAKDTLLVSEFDWTSLHLLRILVSGLFQWT